MAVRCKLASVGSNSRRVADAPFERAVAVIGACSLLTRDARSG